MRKLNFPDCGFCGPRTACTVAAYRLESLVLRLKRTDFRKTLVVQGHAFDVTISEKSDGREVVRVEGAELQRLMQQNQHTGLRAAFYEELERVRAKRRV